MKQNVVKEDSVAPIIVQVSNNLYDRFKEQGYKEQLINEINYLTSDKHEGIYVKKYDDWPTNTIRHNRTHEVRKV